MFAMLGVFSNFPCRGIFEKEDEEVGWRMANIENAEKFPELGTAQYTSPHLKGTVQYTSPSRLNWEQHTTLPHV